MSRRSPRQPAASVATVRAYAPGSVGNVGPGLDIMGMALAGPGDVVEATRAAESGVVVLDAGHPDLPREAGANTAALAAQAALRLAGRSGVGLTLRITKGLPLSGGQGGSAASAVAGAVATNGLFGLELTEQQLLEAALAAEACVAGWHLDNILPSLVGGIVLIRDAGAYDYVRLPVPPGLRVVVAHPSQRLRTAEGRAVLPSTIPRDVAVYQAAQVAAMVLAFSTNDQALLRRALDDRIAEPARAPLLPGFSAAKRAALDAGALGCSISGSGPTAFAFAADQAAGERIGKAMQAAYQSEGVGCVVRVTEVSPTGATSEVVA
ncbi:MAG TPA: homoserine kinase [Gemmatimonadales bacterium]